MQIIIIGIHKFDTQTNWALNAMVNSDEEYFYFIFLFPSA